MSKIIIYFLTVFAGIASTIQGTYNGFWKDKLDLKIIILMNSIVMLVCSILWILFTYKNGFKMPLDRLNLSIVVGGISGFTVITIAAIAFPAIGAFKTTLLFIFGQIAAALLFDHFGFLNLKVSTLDIQKTMGLLLVFMGVYLVFDK